MQTLREKVSLNHRTTQLDLWSTTFDVEKDVSFSDSSVLPFLDITKCIIWAASQPKRYSITPRQVEPAGLSSFEDGPVVARFGFG